MIKIPKTRYSEINGKKYFVSWEKMQIQCAYCLFLSGTKFIRNKQGLIVGIDIEFEEHSENCKQK